MFPFGPDPLVPSLSSVWVLVPSVKPEGQDWAIIEKITLLLNKEVSKQINESYHFVYFDRNNSFQVALNQHSLYKNIVECSNYTHL